MRRRVFAITSVISLLLCGLLIVGSSVTLHSTKEAVFRRGPNAYGVCSRGGFLSAAVWRFEGPPLDPRMIEYANDFVLTYRIPSGGNGDVLSAFGLDYFNESIRPDNIEYPSGLRSFKVFSINYGTLICLALLLPAIWGFRARRRQIWRKHWKRTGRCVSCGYDLTGNTSGQCPECGGSIDQKSSDENATRV